MEGKGGQQQRQRQHHGEKASLKAKADTTIEAGLEADLEAKPKVVAEWSESGDGRKC